MNKSTWQEVIRKTKYASRKKRLSKKELVDVMTSFLALERMGLKYEPDLS